MTEELEPAARRNKFFRTAGHDLRNPIAALIGYAALIETGRELDEEQKHFLSRLQDTAAKLHDAATKLVEVAWIEAEMPLEQVPVALHEVVAGVVEALTPLAQEKKLSLSYAPPLGTLMVLGDGERLDAAVHELLHNAIRYSGEGKNVGISVWNEANEAYCSVTDEGIGIAENERAVIFDRLYRSRDARVKAIPGGGMGLMLARKIAQRHGGNIEVISELDKGSTFTLRLPIHKSEPIP